MLSRISGTTARKFLHNRVALVITLVLALVGTSGVVLTGAITTGLIYACVNNSSGTIKIVSAIATCATNEIQLVWYGDLTPQLAAEAAAREAADADLQAQISAEVLARTEADTALDAELDTKVAAVTGGVGIAIEGDSNNPVVGVAAGSITTDLLADSAVSPEKLNTAGAALGQVLMLAEGGAQWGSITAVDSLDSLAGIACNTGDTLLRGVLKITYTPSGVNTIPSLVCEPTARFTLTASVASGGGKVSSQPIGIVCGVDCTEEFIVGEHVVLRASPNAGFELDAWSGACTGASSTCFVTMDGDKTVTATFKSLPTYTLTVTRSGDTSGGIVKSVMNIGIACGTDCTQSYVEGAVVSLSATPASGFKFFGWSGACSGTGACTLVMTEDKTVNAKFATPVALTIQVRKIDLFSRRAGGSVSLRPDGVVVDGVLPYGQTVQIFATPETGSTATFGDACAGLGVPIPGKTTIICTLTLTADTLVTVTFQRVS